MGDVNVVALPSIAKRTREIRSKPPLTSISTWPALLSSVLARAITRTPRGCTCEHFSRPFYLADGQPSSGTCKHASRQVDREKEDPRIDYARSRSRSKRSRSPARSKKSTRNDDRDSTRPLTPAQKLKAIKSLSLPFRAFNPGAMTYGGRRGLLLHAYRGIGVHDRAPNE